MRLSYLGKKIVYDDFGNVKSTFQSCASIIYSDKETTDVCKALDACSGTWRYDLFADADVYSAQVIVENRADYDDFAAEFRQQLAVAKLHEGDTVYAIVRDNHFQPVLIKATVTGKTATEIIVEEAGTKHCPGIAYTTYTFPLEAVEKELFVSKAKAAKELSRKG